MTSGVNVTTPAHLYSSGSRVGSKAGEGAASYWRPGTWSASRTGGLASSLPGVRRSSLPPGPEATT
jgi:hypothetical protein